MQITVSNILQAAASMALVKGVISGSGDKEEETAAEVWGYVNTNTGTDYKLEYFVLADIEKNILTCIVYDVSLYV